MEHKSEGEAKAENLQGGVQMEKERSSAGSVRAIKITPGCDRGDRERPEDQTETLR